MSIARQIPQLKTNIRIRHTFRFINTNAQTLNVSPTALAGICGTVVTNATTTATAIFNSFKVNKVSIYCAESTAGTPVTCSVEWFGFNNSPPIEDSRTSVSTSVPITLHSTPPPNSLAKFWQVVSGTTLFTIVVPAGSVIDIDLDAMLVDTGATFQNYTISTGATGQLYYLALDNQSGHNFTPVSLTTTF